MYNSEENLIFTTVQHSGQFQNLKGGEKSRKIPLSQQIMLTSLRQPFGFFKLWIRKRIGGKEVKPGEKCSGEIHSKWEVRREQQL